MINLLLAWRIDFVVFSAVVITSCAAFYASRPKTDRPPLRKKILAVASILIVMTGALMEFGGNFERNRIREMLSDYAPTYARMMMAGGVEKISPQTPDDDPRYLDLIELQKRWLALNPTVNDIYTFAQKSDGTVVLLVDSETDYDRNGVYDGDREQRTAIGETYEPSAALLKAFEGRNIFDDVPYTDRWGTWVSAYSPLRDSSGKIIGVLGVDYDASKWITRILEKRLGMELAALVLLLAMIFSFSLKRYSTIILFLLFGTALSGFAAWSVRDHETDKQKLIFRQAAEERINSVIATLGQHLYILNSVESFYASSQAVDRDEFRTFTEPFLKRDPEIKNLQWIPRVPAEEREKFMASASEDGITDFEFRELDAQGRLVRAADRPEYYPTYYVEPAEKNARVLGYDHGADPSRLAAILKARDTGRQVVTPGIVSEAGRLKTDSSVLVLSPVLRDVSPGGSNFAGVVAGLYDVADIFQTAMQGFEPRSLTFVLADRVPRPQMSRVILSMLDTGEKMEPYGNIPASEDAWTISRQFEFCDRTWELTVTTQNRPTLKDQRYALAALAGGLVLTLAIAAYLLMLVRHAARQEEMAESSRRAAEALRSSEERTRGALEESKKSHEELKRTQMQLIQADRLSAIGQLAAGVAHEINNPVGFVNSNLSTLNKYRASLAQYQESAQKLLESFKGEGGNPAEAKKLAEEMLALGERLKINFIFSDMGPLIQESQSGLDRVKKIVLDLKTFVRADSKENMDLADLNEILTGTINVVWNELKYKANLVKELGHIPKINCNSQQMGQVFINMLVNAAQAIKDSGTITVRTFVREGSVCVDIEDTGEGIPDDVIDHIFDPFFTTKEVGKGTGLGLGISYDIVKKHGGRIDVVTKVGQGTKFTVVIPLTSCPMPTSK